ncbi:uncharacterized protein [Malus domestica]|uniref:uncharacterized protein n=1 Tax=Malus domestica TaxID=3750 RepID=UPI0039760EEA
MEGLVTKFGSSLSLSEKEKGRVKIGKKDVEGALLGFHYSVVAEVFSVKPINDTAFVDQFTSLWRGREGVSIRALGGARFMARFVGRRDMYRVLESETPWLFREDLVLVADGAKHGRWNDPLHLVTMWVQFHNVLPLNMTEAIAWAISGVLGTVVKVDRDDGRDCIGRFLRVKITFDVRKSLMRGTNVVFPDDETMWVDFQYEGLPSYCLICGKVGHVTRWSKEERMGDEASDVEMGDLVAFKGLDADYDLRGNCLGVKKGGQRGQMGRSEENERRRLEREKAFDAGLIGPGRFVTLGVGSVELLCHPEVVAGISENPPMLQQSKDIDLNIPIMEVVEEGLAWALGRYGVEGDVGQDIASQDSDPFNLLPIIEAVSKGRMKRGREAEEEDVAVLDDGFARGHKIQRSITDQTEATCNWLHSPEIVALLETKNNSQWFHFLKRRLGMSCMHAIEPRGIAGGLCVFWRAAKDVVLVKYGEFFIKVLIADGVRNLRWCLVVVYASTVASKREQQFEVGGNERTVSSMRTFRTFVAQAKLLDLVFVGYPYTWRNRKEEGFIQERLDRALATHDSIQSYQQTVVKHVVLEGLDHAMLMKGNNEIYLGFLYPSDNPYDQEPFGHDGYEKKGFFQRLTFRAYLQQLVLLTEVVQPRHTKRFMYDPRWNLDPKCDEIVRACWGNTHGGTHALNILHRL